VELSHLLGKGVFSAGKDKDISIPSTLIRSAKLSKDVLLVKGTAERVGYRRLLGESDSSRQRFDRSGQLFEIRPLGETLR
jgi:hypothetical protein